MSEDQTTAAVQRYIDALDGDAPPIPSSGRCWTAPLTGWRCLCRHALQ